MRSAVWLLLATSACAVASDQDEQAAALGASVSKDGAPVLAPVFTILAEEVLTRSPGTVLGLAGYDFTTGEYAGIGDTTKHVSASEAKTIWVAAALHRTSIADVTPYAAPIFEVSSNAAATEVIKLATPNYLNDYYRLAGMTGSAFTKWSDQTATNSPAEWGLNNYVTAKDHLSFLNTVFRDTILEPAQNTQLKEWMTLSPRSGFGGWIGSLLPASTRATMMHKAGWIPPPSPSRCVNEIGLIDAGGGHWYALVILARLANDYDAQQAFVEHASCVVYEAVSHTKRDCR